MQTPIHFSLLINAGFIDSCTEITWFLFLGAGYIDLCTSILVVAYECRMQKPLFSEKDQNSNYSSDYMFGSAEIFSWWRRKGREQQLDKVQIQSTYTIRTSQELPECKRDNYDFEHARHIKNPKRPQHIEIHV